MSPRIEEAATHHERAEATWEGMCAAAMWRCREAMRAGALEVAAVYMQSAARCSYSAGLEAGLAAMLRGSR